MAVYKVPQDVEAEDKLLGPFSFRQFIYLIVACIAAFVAYLLAQLFIGLILIPLPIVILFGTLALPLRKDQPMETYLAAMIRFFLKPRTRLWMPEGSISMVTITAPQSVDYQLTKDFGGNEAEQRLSYLAQIVDTQGWSSRGVVGVPTDQSLNDTFVAEAEHAVDVFDDDARVSQSFDNLINKVDTTRRQTMITQLQQAAQQPTSSPSPGASPSDTSVAPLPSNVQYNPYPTSMHQQVISPAGQAPVSSTAAPTTSNVQRPTSSPAAPMAQAVSPDIMRLANNKDLSVSALAREAHRLEDKDDGEVVISLR